MAQAADAAHELSVLAAWLQGSAPGAATGPVGSLKGDVQHWLHGARVHGVSELLGYAWQGAASMGSAGMQAEDARQLMDGCAGDLRQGVAREMLRQRELGRVLAALAEAGVMPLILKGSALAYDIYPMPALRPRADTDLLLPPGAAGLAGAVLSRLGYGQDQAVSTELTLTQSTWTYLDPLGLAHSLDVHLTASNSAVLARAFGYEGLHARARAIAALHASALGLSDQDALLFACVHRAGHVDTPYRVDDDSHEGGDRLIWFQDMHLLVQRMDRSSLEAFVDQACQAKLAAICHDALVQCARLLGTPVSPELQARLQGAARGEPSAVYLHGNGLERAWVNWRALPGWHERLRWAWELAFPAARYMRGKYPQSASSPLLWLYARRGWSGIRKFLR